MPLALITNTIHGESELTDALTYGEWQERGYQVIKGQMSKVRGPTGGALFTKEQVKLQEFSGDYDNQGDCDYEADQQFFAEYGYDKEY